MRFWALNFSYLGYTVLVLGPDNGVDDKGLVDNERRSSYAINIEEVGKIRRIIIFVLNTTYLNH